MLHNVVIVLNKELEGLMDNSNLKKRLNTFKTTKGYLKIVPDDLLVDILNAWEDWEGSSKSFYSSIEATSKQMASLMGKAKKLKREGVAGSDFKEIKVNEHKISPISSNAPIVLKFKRDKIIRFYEVDHLVDFLKKVA